MTNSLFPLFMEPLGTGGGTTILEIAGGFIEGAVQASFEAGVQPSLFAAVQTANISGAVVQSFTVGLTGSIVASISADPIQAELINGE